jgi:hypothetical protein
MGQHIITWEVEKDFYIGGNLGVRLEKGLIAKT